MELEDRRIFSDQEVEKGETLTLSLLNWSNDPDGDALTFTLTNGPGSINGSTYSLDTTTIEAGQYEVKIKADDERGGVIEDSFIVEVVSTNRPPAKPSNPSPASGEEEVALSPILEWTCSDPDGDTLTFDLYFGTSSNPPKIASAISTDKYQIGPLESSRT